MLKVSQSKIKRWRTCRLSYHFNYNMKLRPRIKGRALNFGTLAHITIEGRLQGISEKKMLKGFWAEQGQMFDEEKDLIKKTVHEAQEIMNEYDEYWKNDKIHFIKYKGNYAEHIIEHPLTDELMFTAKLDALGRTPEGKWLVEHKTFTRETPEQSLWKNIQSAMYNEVWVLMGNKRLDGTLWDFIRSAPIGTPRILKSGELSRATCRTLPLKLKAFMKEEGFKRKHYPELVEGATNYLPDYFKRKKHPVPEGVSQRILKDFISTGREIVELGHKDKTMNIAMHCDFCNFNKLCAMMAAGGDIEHLIEKEYMINDYSAKKEKASKKKGKNKKGRTS